MNLPYDSGDQRPASADLGSLYGFRVSGFWRKYPDEWPKNPVWLGIIGEKTRL